MLALYIDTLVEKCYRSHRCYWCS